jgi:hypothetical protein
VLYQRTKQRVHGSFLFYVKEERNKIIFSKKKNKTVLDVSTSVVFFDTQKKLGLCETFLHVNCFDHEQSVPEFEQ